NRLSETLANCAVWAGRYEIALPPILTNLALTMQPQGDNVTLRNLLKETIEHLPRQDVQFTISDFAANSNQVKENAGYNCLVGEVLEQTGYHDLARQHFERATSLDKEYTQA